ncbi:hypothetical protein Q9290_07480 [Oceanimonas sp. CHS3-5]|uniref:DUF6746 family protein n=1 Tax=Oceanimonas sp. CHS3-5 TaxID=3068186 RepID=UPI00273D2992|nr:DUF6746 family protein [Oceanimonas sp. CHS3-5]MDP5292128.1 hypothetical protein [Oceanimonas sp. CHS3-5]
MMKMRSRLLLTSLPLLLACHVQADTRPSHYKGEPAETLTQAVSNFTDYNARLAELLAGELTPQALSEVHQLTYTLENALARINEETTALADTLEAVHVASESNQPGVVRDRGEAYLEVSRSLVPQA